MYFNRAILQEIGKQIQAARKLKQLTQDELARRAGLHGNSAISRLESGDLEHRLRPAALDAIMQVLELPEEFILVLKMEMGVTIPAWEVMEHLYDQAFAIYHQAEFERSLGCLATIAGNLTAYARQQGWDAPAHKLAFKTYARLAEIYRIKNQQVLELEMFQTALQHAEALGDSLLLAEVGAGLGVTQRMAGRFTQAAEHLIGAQQALSNAAPGAEAERLLANIQLNLVYVTTALGWELETEELVQHVTGLIKKYRNSPADPYWSVWSEQVLYKHIGAARLGRGPAPLAEAQLQEAILLGADFSPGELHQAGLLINRVSAQIALCKLYLQRGQLDAALACVEEVMRDCQLYGLEHQKTKLMKLLRKYPQLHDV